MNKYKFATKEAYIFKIKERAKKALEQYVQKGRKFSDPVDMLWRSQNWDAFIHPGYSVTQTELLSLNEKFDPRSCFGRVVLMVLMLEEFFPESKVQVADVITDALAVAMLDKIKTEENDVYRREMAQEILMYEEPHAVVVVDGFQFDPISVVMRHQIKHPNVRLHDPWDAIATACIVNHALKNDDPVARSITLQRAALFCPNMRVLEQNQLVVKATLDYPHTKDDCKKFISDGLNARILYFMWAEYGCLDLFNHYPNEVIDALKEEVDQQVAKQQEVAL